MLPVLALWLHSCAAGSGGQSLTVDGYKRTYVLHVPQGYSADKAAPLVLALHGRFGTGAGLEKISGLDPMSDREGFIIAYPDGLGRRWNDGSQPSTLSWNASKVDDVKFLLTLIDTLSTQYAIDPARVYAVGESNGAIMCQRLACQCSDRFAAIASVIGTMPKDLAGTCQPDHAISMLMINGTADPLIHWDGGHLGSRSKHGDILSIEDTIALWVNRDGCDPTPQESEEPDRDPGDGTRVYRTANSGGRDGSEVILYKVDGGGHTWPGGSDRQLQWMLGPISRDINASEIIWQFFSGHVRN